ncbi:hypothetical protein BN13_1820001 [Nostocoides jenkinsii Ben 74]|uniref:Uncharacterized protein n=1 Tax=Nostocoides jenkinsii Ben 74 TaxID=1193518 RepID=A0A077M7M3_9MICO|nr:hypothetical protein BN13_1820001 [Tetrasphaera jenkinsii Ben 74]
MTPDAARGSRKRRAEWAIDAVLPQRRALEQPEPGAGPASVHPDGMRERTWTAQRRRARSQPARSLPESSGTARLVPEHLSAGH